MGLSLLNDYINLDPSFKTDLNLWDCLGREIPSHSQIIE